MELAILCFFMNMEFSGASYVIEVYLCSKGLALFENLYFGGGYYSCNKCSI